MRSVDLGYILLIPTTLPIPNIGVSKARYRSKQSIMAI